MSSIGQSKQGFQVHHIDTSAVVGNVDMIIIPEIQIQNGKVITRAPLATNDIVHDISPMQAVEQFISEGASLIQVVDVDAARSQPNNNEEIIKAIVQSSDVPIQVAGGIRTLFQINEWFDIGAARVVLGTVAITDSALVIEAANRHPGGIVVHLATRDGYVMIDGWNTQTAFKATDIIHELQMTGITGVIHRDTEHDNDIDFAESLALTEELSHNVSIPVYSSGKVGTLDDLSRMRYLPNINGAIISHALLTGEFTLSEALKVAKAKETLVEPESVTSNVDMGLHDGIHAYLAAYNTSAPMRAWNRMLRDQIMEDNPYMEVVIPQEDIHEADEQTDSDEMRDHYLSCLDKASIVIVNLEGVENSTWTGYECGYARGTGKYIYGIASTEGTESNRLAAMCDEIIRFSASSDMSATVSEISHALSGRVMLNQL